MLVIGTGLTAAACGPSCYPRFRDGRPGCPRPRCSGLPCPDGSQRQQEPRERHAPVLWERFGVLNISPSPRHVVLNFSASKICSRHLHAEAPETFHSSKARERLVPVSILFQFAFYHMKKRRQKTAFWKLKIGAFPSGKGQEGPF